MPSFQEMFSSLMGRQAPVTGQQPNPDPIKNPDGTPKSANPNPTVPSKDNPISDGTGPRAFPDLSNLSGEQSPLAGFEKMWETTSTSADNINTPVTFNIDPKKLIEASKRLDFTKVVDPELAKAALAGDVTAFGQILNSVAQTSFAQSAQTTGKIVETALARQAEAFRKHLPAEIRRNQMGSSLVSKNPALSHPAIAPFIELTKQQLANQFPDATADQLTMVAEKYFEGVARTITEGGRKPDPSTKTKGLGTDDWMDDFAGIKEAAS